MSWLDKLIKRANSSAKTQKTKRNGGGSKTPKPSSKPKSGGGSKPSASKPSNNSRGNERRQGAQRAQRAGRSIAQKATNAAQKPKTQNKAAKPKQTGTQAHRGGNQSYRATVKNGVINRRQQERQRASAEARKTVVTAKTSAQNRMSASAQKANEQRKKNPTTATGTRPYTVSTTFGKDKTITKVNPRNSAVGAASKGSVIRNSGNKKVSLKNEYSEPFPMIETSKNKALSNYWGKQQSAEANNEIDKQIKDLKDKGYTIDEAAVKEARANVSPDKLSAEIYKQLEESRKKENAKKRKEYNKENKGTITSEPYTMEEIGRVQVGARIGGKAGTKALGEKLAKKTGDLTAISANKNAISRASHNFMQGSGYGDVDFGSIGEYSPQARKALQESKESFAGQVGYAAGQLTGFAVGGVGQAGRGVIAGMGEKAATKMAAEIAAKKVGKDAAEKPPRKVLVSS